MALRPTNFRFVQELARESAAIVIEPGKEYLVEARLDPVARKAGFATLDAFIDHLRSDRNASRFQEQVIDAITINETSFFRDFYPFETLRQHVLPALIRRRGAARRLQIWSAASSTGQEAYSIALVIREHFPELRDWTVSILGTDLSPTVLAQARSGTFSQLEINRGLSAAMVAKYFDKAGDCWRLKPAVKDLVEFRQMNLSRPWPALPVFDLVFIRNVLIYFGPETRKAMLQRVRQCLHPTGYLYLGTTESIVHPDTDWSAITYGKTVVYQSRPGSGTGDGVGSS